MELLQEVLELETILCCNQARNSFPKGVGRGLSTKLKIRTCGTVYCPGVLYLILESNFYESQVSKVSTRLVITCKSVSSAQTVVTLVGHNSRCAIVFVSMLCTLGTGVSDILANVGKPCSAFGCKRHVQSFSGNSDVCVCRSWTFGLIRRFVISSLSKSFA